MQQKSGDKGRRVLEDTTATMAAQAKENEKAAKLEKPKRENEQRWDEATKSMIVKFGIASPGKNWARNHECVLDFSGVTRTEDWAKIACTNGAIVEVQKLLRELSTPEQLDLPENKKFDMYHIMIEARGKKSKVSDPVAEAERFIAMSNKFGRPLPQKEKDAILAEAHKVKAALRAAKPSNVEELQTGKGKAAKAS